MRRTVRQALEWRPPAETRESLYGKVARRIADAGIPTVPAALRAFRAALAAYNPVADRAEGFLSRAEIRPALGALRRARRVLVEADVALRIAMLRHADAATPYHLCAECTGLVDANSGEVCPRCVQLEADGRLLERLRAKDRVAAAQVLPHRGPAYRSRVA